MILPLSNTAAETRTKTRQNHYQQNHFRIGVKGRKDDDASNDLLVRIAAGADHAERDDRDRPQGRPLADVGTVSSVRRVPPCCSFQEQPALAWRPGFDKIKRFIKESMMSKSRVILVGTGGRSVMWRDSAALNYPDSAELVGLCDINPGRLELAQKQLKEKGLAKPVPLFPPDQFEARIRELKATLVIVTSRDSTHDHFIVRALDSGCDVITEKPMTIDAPRCQAIVDAVKRSGRQVRVTFNYRYAPPRRQVKELLQSGVIGKVLSVEFKWLLDTSHGADYFRRWHRNKENSGGLMVHKATHHFDLVNWWVNSVPEKVAAFGSRLFYTPEQALRYGLANRGERCCECEESFRCPVYFDIKGNAGLRDLYFDQEKHDGYKRDQCVFSSRIDIEDTMNVIVEYRNKVRMSYVLTAFSPWEGYHVVFNGTKGRLEHICRESAYVNGDGRTPGELLKEGTTINVMPHFTRGYFVPVEEGKGGHGGGDVRLMDDLFLQQKGPDPLGLRADFRGGAYSILTGIAANLSMKEGRVVNVAELVSGVPEPDYPPTPAWDEPIVIPEFIRAFEVSPVQPMEGPIAAAPLPASTQGWKRTKVAGGFLNLRSTLEKEKGVVYTKAEFFSESGGEQVFGVGSDGPIKVWLNGVEAGVYPDFTNPAGPDKARIPVTLKKGANEVMVALDNRGGNVWGLYARFSA
jgi:predicted dehydrogenase